MSSAQERLWFLHQLAPASAVYNAPVAIRMVGTLNLRAIEQSLTEIVRRHEILRTTFATIEGSAVQIIAPAGPLALEHLSVRGRSDGEAEAQRLIRDKVWRPLNLTIGAAWRGSLIQLNEQEHILLLAMHHIIFNGQSFGPLLHELTTLYNALTQGAPPTLEALPFQYADYACWQHEWLKSDDFARQLSYWKSKLEGHVPVLNLSTDCSRPPLQSFQGARESLHLSKSCSDSLKKLSQAEGVTLFITLLAAFQTLLHRYTGQTEIVVGTPVTDRSQPGLEALIGFFVNTLVLSMELSGNLSFRQLLKRTRAMAVEAYEHREVPFEKVVEVLQTRRDLSRSPLFQIMFILQDTLEVVSGQGIEFTLLEPPTGVSKFDLTLEMENRDQGLKATIEFSTNLFENETIRRMLGHFRALLEAIVAAPDSRLSEIPLLMPAERQLLLADWNATETPYQKELCVHQLFEAQVERAPNAAALVFDSEQMSYGELNARANQLAHFLRARRVGPESLVGLCLERSPEMVVAILGVLKAGGAYVPLDPGYPKDRLAFMIEDSRISVLLTQEYLQESLPPYQDSVIFLDAEWPLVAQESTRNPVNLATTANLAYVIYTSGSTARPKGVMLCHRGLGNLSVAQVQNFGMGPGSRVLQFSSPSFDASVWELVMSLTTGGSLCLGKRGASFGEGSSVAEALRDQEVTIITLPPSVLASLSPEELPELRTIISAGESCPREVVDVWARGREFFNAYGPTESTVCASLIKCQAAADGAPTIGRAIANFSLYILDEYGNPQPIGVPGELHIGGPGLARGYLNRPDLTAERFIPDPFSVEPGARIYRTGDRARYLADGQIEFLGRIDDQVKLRGFRIELGEIETTLNGAPDVQHAIVLVREDQSGEKRLVAYVVAGGEHKPTVEELRDFLRERLPAFMIPALFVLLDDWPLTPNGKIDRKQLPEPQGERPHLKTTFVAPKTELEQRMCTLWQEALGIDTVGVNDNLFDLGGHSLMMLRVHQKLEEFVPHGLSLVELFKYPTIASFAEHLNRRGEDTSAPNQRDNRAEKQRAALTNQVEIRRARRQRT